MIDVLSFIFGQRIDFEHVKLYITTPVEFKVSFQYILWSCNDAGTIRVISQNNQSIDVDFVVICDAHRYPEDIVIRISNTTYRTRSFVVKGDGIYIRDNRVLNFNFGNRVSFAVRIPHPRANTVPVIITLAIEPPAYDLTGRLYTRGDIGIPNANLNITVEDAYYYGRLLTDIIKTFDDGGFRYVFSVPASFINVYINFPGGGGYLPANLELLWISGYNPAYIEASVMPLPRYETIHEENPI